MRATISSRRHSGNGESKNLSEILRILHASVVNTRAIYNQEFTRTAGTHIGTRPENLRTPQRQAETDRSIGAAFLSLSLRDHAYHLPNPRQIPAQDRRRTG